jgi:hypothetical protein
MPKDPVYYPALERSALFKKTSILWTQGFETRYHKPLSVRPDFFKGGGVKGQIF